MSQKFFTDSIQSNFIKCLLYNTPLPIYKTVDKGDYVLEDSLYICGKHVVKATASGTIGVDADVRPIAEYDFGKYYIKYCERFQSSTSYYDYETHKWLGNYLRAYRDLYHIDLMPFYNCFSDAYVDDLYIDKEAVVAKTESSVKVLKVPIKFNKTYTIALDCNSQVYLAPALLTKNNELINVSIQDGESSDLSSYLVPRITKYNSLTFRAPITFRVDNKDDGTYLHFYHKKTAEAVSIKKCKFLERYERNLFLLIQLPIKNSSSVTVLEGDYRNVGTEKIFNVEAIDDIDDTKLNHLLLSDLALLQFNNQTKYPFSSRLIEYLLKNPIDSQEENAKNIIKVQSALGMLGAEHVTEGVWSNYVRKIAFDQYKENTSGGSKFRHIDINGYIDKNIESFLS